MKNKSENFKIAYSILNVLSSGGGLPLGWVTPLQLTQEEKEELARTTVFSLRAIESHFSDEITGHPI